MKGGILYKGCRYRCHKQVSPPADEGAVIESINLSAYLSARNLLSVSTLCPLADRLTDFSRFLKLGYIFSTFASSACFSFLLPLTCKW